MKSRRARLNGIGAHFNHFMPYLRSVTMKAKLIAALMVSTTMFPMIAFAQSQPVTRAQVQAQIVQAERDGTLHPSNVHYPDGVVATSAADNSGYGTATAGNSQSGSTVSAASVNALYRHR
jgi:hypothetical protein